MRELQHRDDAGFAHSLPRQSEHERRLPFTGTLDVIGECGGDGFGVFENVDDHDRT